MTVIAWIIAGLLMIILGRALAPLIAALVLIAIKVTCAAALGVGTALAVSYAANQAGYPAPEIAGAAAGLLLFLTVANALLHQTGAVKDHPSPTTSSCAANDPRQPELADEGDRPLESDPVVQAAWAKAEQLVGANRELNSARRSCAALLRLANEDELDVRLIDLAAMVTRNVPALVAEVSALWIDGTPQERRNLAEGLSNDLVSLGEASAKEVERRRSERKSRLTALRAHVAARIGDENEGG
ncbi:hypothetical protein C7W88_01725 [Novosphingobium sp. THN1]|uniref:hypothetical protein n=1 Tax=Novosphingobium sp. THN1 TaxID=1016987 RepID=UPI000E4A8494|nr:hypothetical protein [Novosphingobium sp. THN1]AXU18065.1 hypothetical protein C7W88_01725 [Novosphingobium sp. THN1]